ncbi:MAG: hypothetical protein NC085_04035 [Muribaculaceae bacterium]|nr:hypothetical protein [Muribaculaceae bacterium]
MTSFLVIDYSIALPSFVVKTFANKTWNFGVINKKAVIILLMTANVLLKATPHKKQLTPLPHICLHIFRHITLKFLDIRQYACEILVQSDEKSAAHLHGNLCAVLP